MENINRILSVSLRAKQLDEIIGQDDVVSVIKNQLSSGRVPHFYIISGSPGTGKTSLARIIAMMLQQSNKQDSIYGFFNYDNKEINGAVNNGIDDIRYILETVNYKPLPPSSSKVIIIDEAHQLTAQAQNALLKITEDSPDHLYIIFCTSVINKILPTLQRRAYILNTHGIDNVLISKLLLNAKESVGYKGDTEELENVLIENEITSPGLILQAAEKFFNGLGAKYCILGISSNTTDTKILCQSISKGDFKGILNTLKLLKKEDITSTRLQVLGYLKVILLENGSLRVAKAIKVISEECHELPLFLANLYIAADLISK